VPRWARKGNLLKMIQNITCMFLAFFNIISFPILALNQRCITIKKSITILEV
jgi:hypothetical protein